MKDLKIGDVIICTNHFYKELINRKGKVLKVNKRAVSVEFEESNIYLHGGSGLGKKSHCWNFWYSSKSETIVKFEEIVVNKSKLLNDTTAINADGEVFKIGDSIKLINSNSDKSSFKILSFRWKNDKSEICAVVPNMSNGIGIDKIELYIEPLTGLEK
jgi:hypothetical protein